MVSLQRLAALAGAEGKPVYVSGGKAWELDSRGKLLSAAAPEAQPYLWPIAHDVRPAAQSLDANGIRRLRHSSDAEFFFGAAPVDSPSAPAGSPVEMTDFEQVDRAYTTALAYAFRLRPWLKLAGFASSAVLVLLLAAYAGRGLLAVSRYGVGRGS